jgi:Mor family transcriptional regulator
MEIADLPSPVLQEVAKKVGIGVVKELILKCGGTVLYIPNNFSKQYCRRYICKHWDGKNVKQMAEDLGITERTVYRHLDAKI